MLRRNIVNQLLNQNGLAYAGTAEETDFTALCVGLQEVDNLDAGFQNLDDRALLLEGGRFAVDAPVLGSLVVVERRPAVQGLPESVENPPENVLAHGNHDALAGGLHGHILRKAFAGRKHDAAHHAAADVLRDLHLQLLAVQKDDQCFPDGRQLAPFKFHIHDRPGDLYNLTDTFHASSATAFAFFFAFFFCSAFAPPTTSVISWVMAA